MADKETLYERTIASETIYDGRIIQVKVDQVVLPNGKTAQREIVHHPGAVAVLPLTDDGKMIAVRQFRKPLELTIVEIPAGKLEKGEDPLACARRELEEETGYQAEHFEHLSSFYTSPGFADELLHLYVATGLKEGKTVRTKMSLWRCSRLRWKRRMNCIARARFATRRRCWLCTPGRIGC